MRLLDSFLLALRAVTVNKMRSILTILGIVIGVAAVIALMSVGKGTQAMITARIESMGSNLIYVVPGAVREGGVSGMMGSAQTLTYQDAEAIATSPDASAVGLVASETFVMGQVVAGRNNLNTRVIGTTPEYAQVRNIQVGEGEFIAEQHLAAKSMVAVLGANVAQTLFTDGNALGKSFKINRRTFRVIGVLERKGGFVQLQDDTLIIPITTAQSRVQMQRNTRAGTPIQTIYIQAVDGKEIEAAVEQVKTVLRQRHRIKGNADDFTVTSMEDVLGTLKQVTQVFTIFLGAIAGISLLVGGIGIMNIMLVSVTERTREIGIRKAVGARRRDILGQFLVEATFLSLLGGVMGVGAGWGISSLVSSLGVSGMGGQPIQTMVTSDIVILALTMAAAIGLISGGYPAFRAARLDPIVALRYE